MSCALAEIGRHRVGGVAEDGDPVFRPALQTDGLELGPTRLGPIRLRRDALEQSAHRGEGSRPLVRLDRRGARRVVVDSAAEEDVKPVAVDRAIENAPVAGPCLDQRRAVRVGRRDLGRQARDRNPEGSVARHAARLEEIEGVPQSGIYAVGHDDEIGAPGFARRGDERAVGRRRRDLGIEEDFRARGLGASGEDGHDVAAVHAIGTALGRAAHDDPAGAVERIPAVEPGAACEDGIEDAEGTEDVRHVGLHGDPVAFGINGGATLVNPDGPASTGEGDCGHQAAEPSADDLDRSGPHRLQPISALFIGRRS
jgi:hypothetical protein